MSENLLGKHTPVVEHYSPELLHPIPRASGREELRLRPDDFCGEDIWHAWELSWMSKGERPRVAVGRFSVPAESPNLVESKSFKLYLNSLNLSYFGSRDELASTLRDDLSAVAGTAIGVEILPLDDASLEPGPLPGHALDGLKPQHIAPEPGAGLLQRQQETGEALYHSHLLRSLCPVTSQPDWASLVIEIHGQSPVPESLLGYILSFRNHREFHEQCVERIYSDLWRACQPEFLSVQALYTRRGGLDINPWRCSEDRPAPRRRSPRQ